MSWTPEQRREYQRTWRARNPEKVKQYDSNFREQRRARKARNRDKVNEQSRARRALDPGRNQHGRWIKEDRTAMWDAQDGRCYLCGDDLIPGKEDIDHDHACCPQGRSCRTCRRGLAHHRCNVIIGWAQDDPARLRYMADALEAAQLAFKQRQAGSASNGLLF